jgi:hypothetical protein
MSSDLQFAQDIAEILNEYDADTRRKLEETEKKIARECADYLRQTSPRKSGIYAQGWSARKNGDGWVAYNKTKPGLTHLLNNGHESANKWGKYPDKPTEGDNHIGQAEEEFSERYIDAVYTNLS